MTVETLRHELDVFLWENPEWATSQVVIEYENGGRIFARRPVKQIGIGYGPRPFNIRFEEKTIFDGRNGEFE